MKGKVSVLTMIGVLLYVVYSLIDRFIVEIPDIAAIPVIMVGTICILTGIVKTSKDNAIK